MTGAPLHDACCRWCGAPFIRRRGGRRQVFCRRAHKNAFWAAVYRFVGTEIDAGRFVVEPGVGIALSHAQINADLILSAISTPGGSMAPGAGTCSLPPAVVELLGRVALALRRQKRINPETAPAPDHLTHHQ
jgi:hypothetical protein